MNIESDEPSLKEVLGEELSPEDQKRLKWAGIHNVSQLRQLEQQSGENVLEQIVQIPAGRLRKALKVASQPRIRNVSRLDDAKLRIKGANLRKLRNPKVQIDGRALNVFSSSDEEIVVEGTREMLSGALSIQSDSGIAASFDLSNSEESWSNPQQEGGHDAQ